MDRGVRREIVWRQALQAQNGKPIYVTGIGEFFRLMLRRVGFALELDKCHTRTVIAFKFRNTEVGNSDYIRLINQDILRFDVAMNDVSGKSKGECLKDWNTVTIIKPVPVMLRI